MLLHRYKGVQNMHVVSERPLAKLQTTACGKPVLAVCGLMLQSNLTNWLRYGCERLAKKGFVPCE